jgi:methyl-accepting chemotaxis protein
MLYRFSVKSKLFLALSLLAAVALTIALHATLAARQVGEKIPGVDRAAREALMAERLDGLVKEAVMESRGIYLAATAAVAEPAVRRLESVLGEIEAMELGWADGVASTDLAPGAIRQGVARFVAFRKMLAAMAMAGDPAGARALGNADNARVVRLQLTDDLQRLKTRAQARMLDEGREAAEEVSSMQALVSMIAITCVVVAVGLAFFLSMVVIARPIEELTRSMTRLAEGDTTIALPPLDRFDEIGDMSRALAVLRDAVKRNNDLVTELKSRDDREAVLRRQAEVKGRAMSFDQRLRAWINDIGSLITQLSDAAGAMTASSSRSRIGSEFLTESSRKAAAEVSQAAASAEQLSRSVEDIERRIVESAAIVRQTVETARQTGFSVDDLAAISNRVGGVVQVIGEIAGQTNLLALNATIEAARAGEAGRGFAVVAAEVKSLASQTARATAEIAEQIDSMQRAGAGSAAALRAIQTKIAEVDEISAAIAVTADRQRASTASIAATIRSTADGAQAMAKLAEDVDASSFESAQSAGTFLSIVREIDRQAVAMREEVERFFQMLEAA